MFLSQKTKGFFVEMNDQAIMLARTSAPTLPFTIEELRECPPNDAVALADALSQIQPKKSPTGYLHAVVESCRFLSANRGSWFGGLER